MLACSLSARALAVGGCRSARASACGRRFLVRASEMAEQPDAPHTGAEAEGFAKFNFAPGSARDSIIHGAERPGMRGEWDSPGAIPQSAVEEWAEFMKGQGVTRGLSVMSDEEMEWFAPPGPLGSLPVYDHVFLKNDGAAESAMAALKAADEAGEKLVLHCCGGQGRTGLLLAAWLVERHGLTPDDAAAEVCRTFATGIPKNVMAFAEKSGVNRKVTGEKVAKFLGL